MEMKMHGNRSAAGVGLACLGLALVFLTASQAAALANAEAGQWDMSYAATDRTCRMTLAGTSLDMPALCRRSLPVLAKVDDLPKTGKIAPAGASDKPVPDFVEKSGHALAGLRPEGERLLAVNVDQGSAFEPEDVSKAPGFDVVQAAPSKPPPSSPSKPASAPEPSAAPPPKPSAAALALKPDDVAGRYSLQRERGKDAGCLLILDDKVKAPGGYKASLAPACRDQGIMIFDPVGWRLAKGRLVLTARRGHTTHLDLQADGTWLKDPNDGKPLLLKKM
jgi:hypothetical protein